METYFKFLYWFVFIALAVAMFTDSIIAGLLYLGLAAIFYGYYRFRKSLR